MINYVTGKTIKDLRTKNGFTQKELADKLMVSDKTISKWEQGRGLPDISMLEPLAKVFKISVSELLAGECISNVNKCSNMKKSKFYVCPVCSNVIHSVGEGMFSCCGISLMPLSFEDEDNRHIINAEFTDNSWYVSLEHEMNKDHYISFIAYITDSRVNFVKLYPEQNPEAVFLKNGRGIICAYCNKHGLFKINV